jgi:hypothetical protein
MLEYFEEGKAKEKAFPAFCLNEGTEMTERWNGGEICNMLA